MKWIYELNVGDVLPVHWRGWHNTENFDLVVVERVTSDLVTVLTRHRQPVYYTMDGYERCHGVKIKENYLMEPTAENIAKARHSVLARALEEYEGRWDNLPIETLQQIVDLLGVKPGLEDL